MTRPDISCGKFESPSGLAAGLWLVGALATAISISGASCAKEPEPSRMVIQSDGTTLSDDAARDLFKPVVRKGDPDTPASRKRHDIEAQTVGAQVPLPPQYIIEVRPLPLDINRLIQSRNPAPINPNRDIGQSLLDDLERSLFFERFIDELDDFDSGSGDTFLYLNFGNRGPTRNLRQTDLDRAERIRLRGAIRDLDDDILVVPDMR